MTAPAHDRQTGAEAITWDMSIYYQGLDDPQIVADMAALQTALAAFVASYKGQISTLSAAQLAEALGAMEGLYERWTRLSSFCGLNFTTYTNDPAWGALYQKFEEASAQWQAQIVFFSLEWNALEDDHAARLMADPALANYRYYLEAERLEKPYQLSEAEERILIEKSVTANGAWERLHGQLGASHELDYLGEKRPMEYVLSIGMRHAERAKRIAAADAVTATLKANALPYTFIFNTLLGDKAINDRLRKYPSWIRSRNISNRVDDSVVEALIHAVTSRYEIVARHYRLKRALMGYDELFDYDRYAPLGLHKSEAFYTWDEARDIVLNAFHSFSPRMGHAATRFFDERWIHAPALKGKRGGAYASYGTKATHPWVFVNYTGNDRSVSTLAHEMGHGVHMYLSREAQSLFNMYTPLTTAEMASTFAEMMVFNDLRQRESDPVARLSMLADKIEDAFATIFRQIAMNRFEDAIHHERRNAGELSTARFSELWMQTQRAQFGDSVTLREDYGYWWMYIGHFLHTPGYVYAYSFGELLVLALFKRYQEQGASFVPAYERVLSAGGSDYPHNILAPLGVDLNDPAFWSQGLDILSAMVDEEEALARELFPAKLG